MTKDQVDAFLSKMNGMMLVSGAPGSGNTPVGGGAPIGGGLIIMLVSALAYGTKKTFVGKNLRF